MPEDVWWRTGIHRRSDPSCRSFAPCCQLVSISRGLCFEQLDWKLCRESIVENPGKERNDSLIYTWRGWEKRRVRKAHNYPGLISRLMSGDGSRRRNVAGVRHPIRNSRVYALFLSGGSRYRRIVSRSRSKITGKFN